jgi:hypothetical protein
MSDEIWKTLTKKQKENCRSVYALYLILHNAYHGELPKGVSREYWSSKIISALAAQPYINLPKKKEVLYTCRISKSALNSGESVNEHRYPRKAWLSWRLFKPKNPVSFDEFMRLYWAEGGSYHKTTSQENRQLKTYYQDKSDTAIQDGGTAAYKKCGIVLVDDPSISKEEE